MQAFVGVCDSAVCLGVRDCAPRSHARASCLLTAAVGFFAACEPTLALASWWGPPAYLYPPPALPLQFKATLQRELAAAEAGKDAFVQQMSEADYEEVRPSLL